MDKTVVAWLSIAILDLGVIALLHLALRQVDIRSVLREKASDSQPPGTHPIALAAVAADAGGAQPVAADLALDNTSYSRLAGLVGAVVLARFLWAIGNFVIYQAFTDMTQISAFLGSLSTYFLAGSSLFAPYAFNKLSGIFK